MASRRRGGHRHRRGTPTGEAPGSQGLLRRRAGPPSASRLRRAHREMGNGGYDALKHSFSSHLPSLGDLDPRRAGPGRSRETPRRLRGRGLRTWHLATPSRPGRATPSTPRRRTDTRRHLRRAHAQPAAHNCRIPPRHDGELAVGAGHRHTVAGHGPGQVGDISHTGPSYVPPGTRGASCREEQDEVPPAARSDAGVTPSQTAALAPVGRAAAGPPSTSTTPASQPEPRVQTVRDRFAAGMSTTAPTSWSSTYRALARPTGHGRTPAPQPPASAARPRRALATVEPDQARQPAADRARTTERDQARRDAAEVALRVRRPRAVRSARS